jgi:hypothetical protein
MVDCLSSKHEVLNSNPSIIKTKQNKKKERKEERKTLSQTLKRSGFLYCCVSNVWNKASIEEICYLC